MGSSTLCWKCAPRCSRPQKVRRQSFVKNLHTQCIAKDAEDDSTIADENSNFEEDETASDATVGKVISLYGCLFSGAQAAHSASLGSEKSNSEGQVEFEMQANLGSSHHEQVAQEITRDVVSSQPRVITSSSSSGSKDSEEEELSSASNEQEAQVMEDTEEPQLEQQDPSNDSSSENQICLSVYSKNCRSLKSDTDVGELLEELKYVQWDAILLNETWRVEPREEWDTEEGHRFFATGCPQGRRGVAVLLHRRWKRNVINVERISERLMYIDLRTWIGKTLRLIPAYFPDSTYPDEQVHVVYDALAEVLRSGKKEKACVLVGADMNAVLGDDRTSGRYSSMGKWAIGSQNARGQWAATWTSSQHLHVLNSRFKKGPEKLFTYTAPSGERKQLDYFLGDKYLMRNVMDVEATQDIDLGSDHNCLKLRILLRKDTRPSTSTKRSKKPTKMAAWPPHDVLVYRETLEEQFSNTHLLNSLADKCEQIQEAIKKAMDFDKEDVQVQARAEPPSLLRELIEKRKALGSEGASERAVISKEIKKEMRKMRRCKAEERIEKILAGFSGLGAIAGIKSYRKKTCITELENKDKATITRKQDIADAFADFYEALYSSRSDQKGSATNLSPARVAVFTMDELDAGLKKLKRGKAKDAAGLVAEMLKHGGNKFRHALLDTMNAALDPHATPPDSWRLTVLTVLFKSGDPKLAKNYRPIAMIPLLYKLLTTMLGFRLGKILEPQLSRDQAGFRKHCSTVDHVFALAQLAEKTEEYRQEAWIAVVDFVKAFDSIEHDAIWKALASQGVGPECIDVLKNLYRDQKGQVSGDTPSKLFDISRGTKQGDPLSTLIFSAVAEDIFRDVRQKWRSRNMGIEMSIGPRQHLQSLCFADDVLLAAASSKHIAEMLADLKEAAAQRGLLLHADKTKVLTNASQLSRRRLPPELSVRDAQVQVLDFQDSAKYLGCKFSFHDRTEKELSHRIAAAWASFASHKTELTNRRYPLKHRMRLFNATVGATVLYACECWTLRIDQQKRLRKIQRCMLRMVIGAKRRSVSSDHSATDDENVTNHLEPWPHFLTRTARLAEEKLEEAGQEDWLDVWRRRQWRWVHKLVQQQSHKWAAQALMWDPVLHTQRRAGRLPNRPKKRWKDDICHFLQAKDQTIGWLDLAKSNGDAWLELEDAYVQWCKVK